MLKIAQQDKDEDQLKPKAPDSPRQKTFPVPLCAGTLCTKHTYMHTPPLHQQALMHMLPRETVQGVEWEAPRGPDARLGDWETRILRAKLHT